MLEADECEKTAGPSDATACAAAGSGWVAMSEREPEMEVPVWLLCKGIRSPLIGYRADDVDGWMWARCHYGARWTGHSWAPEDGEFDDLEPTHWHAMPPPPPNATAQPPR
jgi:hypothetical protein